MLLRLLLFATLAATPVVAQHRPAAGSAERKAILDALRPSVEAKFRVPVEFAVQELCVADGAALVIADPRRKGGGTIPWQRVMSREEHDLGGIEVSAILRLRNGRWQLVDSAIGATDVWYEHLLTAGLRRGC